jgi:hypothetical protein
MVGVPFTNHWRFAYETRRHDPSRARPRCSGHGGSRRWYRRRRGGAKWDDDRYAVNPVNDQHFLDAVEDHRT